MIAAPSAKRRATSRSERAAADRAKVAVSWRWLWPWGLS
jgi:hypothetical protein